MSFPKNSPSPSLDPTTQHQYPSLFDPQVNNIAYQILGCLSLAGLAFLLLSAICFRPLREFPSRLIIFLAFGTSIFTESALLSPQIGYSFIASHETVCNGQAAGMIIGYALSYLWFTAIVWNSYLTLVKGITETQERVETIFTVISLLGSSILAVLIQTDSLPIGPSEGLWCWVSASNAGAAEGLEISSPLLLGFYQIIVYIFLFSLYLFSVFCMWKIARVLSSTLELYSQERQQAIRRFVHLASVYILISPIGATTRIIGATYPDTDAYHFFRHLYTSVVLSFGFLIFLIFGTSKAVFSHWKMLFSSLFLFLLKLGVSPQTIGVSDELDGTRDLEGRKSTGVHGLRKSLLARLESASSLPNYGAITDSPDDSHEPIDFDNQNPWTSSSSSSSRQNSNFQVSSGNLNRSVSLASSSSRMSFGFPHHEAPSLNMDFQRSAPPTLSDQSDYWDVGDSSYSSFRKQSQTKIRYL